MAIDEIVEETYVKQLELDLEHKPIQYKLDYNKKPYFDENPYNLYPMDSDVYPANVKWAPQLLYIGYVKSFFQYIG